MPAVTLQSVTPLVVAAAQRISRAVGGTPSCLDREPAGSLVKFIARR